MNSDIWDIRLLDPLSEPGLSDVELLRIERSKA